MNHSSALWSARPSARAWPRWAWVLLSLSLGYSALHLGYSLWRYSLAAGAGSGDFHRVFDQAVELRETSHLSLDAVLHPMFYYVFLRPFTYLGFQRSAAIFYLVQFPLFVMALVLLVQSISRSPRGTLVEYALAGVLTVNFQPFLETIALHKVEGIEVFLICAALFAFKRRRDVLAGALIGVATHLKYLPGLLVLYFLLKREYRVVAGAVIASMLCLLTVLPVLGVRQVRSYVVGHTVDLLADHRHEGNQPDAITERQTLSGTVHRWLAKPQPPWTFRDYLQFQAPMPVPNPSLAHGLVWACQLPLVALYLWTIRRRWGPQERNERWPYYVFEFSLTLIMIFVLAQASRVHYAILLLPAFVTTGVWLVQRREVFQWPERTLFLAAYSLTAMLIPGGLLNRLPPHPMWGERYSDMYLWLSLPFYGYLLLGACIAVCYRRLERWSARSAPDAPELQPIRTVEPSVVPTVP